jgi:hypothetical protein
MFHLIWFLVLFGPGALLFMIKTDSVVAGIMIAIIIALLVLAPINYYFGSTP